MDTVRQYLLSVVAAAVICSVVIKLCGQKKLSSSVIKLLAGILMSVTVISPLVSLQLRDLTEYFEDIQIDAQSITDEGISAADYEKSLIIIDKAEAYILDKASQLGASVQVSVTLSETDDLTPAAVKIEGNISPYARQQLQNMIEQDLGIPEEAQSWN